MKILKRTTTDVRTDRFDIEDGEVRPVPYSRGGATYRVARVTLTSERVNGGDWHSVRSLTLAGPKVKKDGSDGKDEAREAIYGRDGWPDWVTTLANPPSASATSGEAVAE